VGAPGRHASSSVKDLGLQSLSFARRYPIGNGRGWRRSPYRSVGPAMPRLLL
jgi:hypothetical protein